MTDPKPQKTYLSPDDIEKAKNGSGEAASNASPTVLH
jgi:hypothetical protein